MIRDQRHFKIIDYLKRHQFASVEELAQLLKCSQITVRRDINELDSRQLLTKVHGGAQALGDHIEKVDIELIQRSAQNVSEKEMIAKICASLVHDGQTVYLDAGSSVQLVIPYLKGKDIKVYTHGIHLVSELIKYDIACYLIGGDVKPSTLATVGALSLESLARFHFDVAFIGTNAIDLDFGCSTPDEGEAAMKRLIVKAADYPYVLCDHTKFFKKSRLSFAQCSEVNIVSDQKPPHGFAEISVIYPQQS